MRLHEFLSQSWYEYSLFITSHIIGSARQWEHTRALMHLMFCINTTDTNKPTPHELLPLVTDKVPVAPEVSEEDKEKLIAMAIDRAKYLPG